MTRAAIVIQRAYRRYQVRREGLIVALQSHARGYLFRVKWKRRAIRHAFLGQKRGNRSLLIEDTLRRI